MIAPNRPPAPGRSGEYMTRQKVLVLYLANSALDAPVVAWAVYDGTGATRPWPAMPTSRPIVPGSRR